jgi:hypothetical protein
LLVASYNNVRKILPEIDDVHPTEYGDFERNGKLISDQELNELAGLYKQRELAAGAFKEGEVGPVGISTIARAAVTGALLRRASASDVQELHDRSFGRVDRRASEGIGPNVASGVFYSSERRKTDQKADQQVDHSAQTSFKPGGYSVAFQMELHFFDFGRSRKVHFNRANAALYEALQKDPEFAKMMEALIPGLKDSVSSVGGRETPEGWTWEHVSSPFADGKRGVMRLVPRSQHTAGSPWWRVLHPAKGAAGGYAEWAIPNGAPKNYRRRSGHSTLER